MTSEKAILPVVLAFVSALLWGVWWIPIRILESLGVEGAWGAVAMNLGALVAALIWMLLKQTPFRFTTGGLLGAILVGVAVTTYSVAITMADVVRVVLLFYLAPAWSKIIEWAFLGQRWGWLSTAAVGLSLTGAYFVLGGDVSLDAFGFGDILAILSGMAWAGGAAFIFAGARMNATSLSVVTAISAAALGAAFALIGAGTGLSGMVSVSGAAMGGLFGVLYVLPILMLTLWSAQRLPPAVISFLLTAEILSGVITGALFLDEPFGVMQAIGAVLILTAAAVEVVPVVLRGTRRV